MPQTPSKATVRMYNVGFGDCFLLTFHYATPPGDQHILIDFGTLAGGADMAGIAQEIHDTCGGKLYAVIATHRHRDHISGFSDKGGAKSSGAIIASCKPRMVLQPWTENPDAGADDTSAPLLAKGKNKLTDKQLFFASMNAMSAFAEAAAIYAKRWPEVGGRGRMIGKLAVNNVKNPEAVANLRTMAPKNKVRFLQFGSPSGLESATLLPGVKVHVLGPPTLEAANIRKYAKKSPEYWLSCKYWAMQAAGNSGPQSRALFPRGPRVPADSRPFHVRWFIDRAENAFKRNLLDIVNILDSFMNNTSLILLFEFNGKKLLFPGDAQLENWTYALSQPGVKALLSDVDLYKVGHHGSRNATPKVLWEGFEKRKSKHAASVLKTMMSTRAGAYEKSEEGKVPATNLVTALKADSDLLNTQDLKAKRGPIVETF